MNSHFLIQTKLHAEQLHESRLIQCYTIHRKKKKRKGEWRLIFIAVGLFQLKKKNKQNQN